MTYWKNTVRKPGREVATVGMLPARLEREGYGNYKTWKLNIHIDSGTTSYPGIKRELWGVTASVVPMVIKDLDAVTTKLGEWFQQIPETTSEISVQKTAVLGTSQKIHRDLNLTRF